MQVQSILRPLVGWEMGDSFAIPLLTGALKNAVGLRKPNTKA